MMQRPGALLKLIHTSDWHLGGRLHGVDRHEEHEQFLDWLCTTARDQEIDALIVSGDVYDTANPPASAQALFYRFLATFGEVCPKATVIVIAGNHDSGQRLDAPAPVLRGRGFHLIGNLPRTESGTVDTQALLVPIKNREGEVEAWCGAVPFLRPADLPRLDISDDRDPLIEGVKEIYKQVGEALDEVCEPNQARLLTGHLYMAGGETSEHSERRIVIGQEHALPASIFPERLAYGALGHLHRAQVVAKNHHIRYSGSPIPLALDEDRYKHQVLVVEINQGSPTRVNGIAIPRFIDILRVPEEGPLPFEHVLPLLESLPEIATDKPFPFLEVRVLVDRPMPDLRTRLEEVLVDKAVRLVKISCSRQGGDAALADAVPMRQLEDLSPEDVFLAAWRGEFDEDPSSEIRMAFADLLTEAQS